MPEPTKPPLALSAGASITREVLLETSPSGYPGSP